MSVGGGGGGRGPVFVCWFVCFLDSTKSNRLFLNGFRYFYFIHFIHLFCHCHIKHTYISKQILKKSYRF